MIFVYGCANGSGNAVECAHRFPRWDLDVTFTENEECLLSGDKMPGEQAPSAPEEEGKAPQKAKLSLTCMLIWTSAAASVGSGFQHGYNCGVVNAPTRVLTDWIKSSTGFSENSAQFLWSVIVAIFCIGGMIGGFLTRLFADNLGRRNGLIVNNALAVVSGVIMGVSKYVNSPYVLLIGRLIVGINCGVNAGVCPMYLTEISPMRIRGAVGSLYQLLLTISILIAQLLGLSDVLGNDKYWGLLFALIIGPAFYQALALFFSPESPKYLLKKGQEEKAMKACEKLFGKEQATTEFEVFKKEMEEAGQHPVVTIKDMFTTPKLRKPLVIIGVLMLAQQFSGINAVIYYSTEIFQIGSISKSTAQWLTVGVGVINVLMTIVSVFLVEVTGRKPLLFIGFFGMSVVTVVLYINLFFVDQHAVSLYLAIICVYLFIILFAAGAGSIPWMIGSELFVTHARPLGLSMATPANWFANFIVGLIFLPLKTVIGPSVFVFFIVCQILSGLYMLFFVPETKNKPIEEITAKF